MKLQYMSAHVSSVIVPLRNRPHHLQVAFLEAYVNTCDEVGLAGAIARWSMAWVPARATPYAEVYHHMNPSAQSVFFNAPYLKLPPEDIAELEANPAKRQRYIELVTHTWLPTLRTLDEIFTTKVRMEPVLIGGSHLRYDHRSVPLKLRVRELRTQMHLREDVQIDKLEEYMPNALGVPWKALIGTTSITYAHAQTFVRQLESIVERWEGGVDLGLLQPVAPWPHGPLSIIFIMLKQMISKKELELLGVSSGTGAASGRDVAILDATKDAT
jgi:hypothetical protein